MAANSKIEWTTDTWNPIRGCSRVSDECTRCYAEGVAHRFSGPGQPYDGLTKVVNGVPTWNGKIMLVPDILDQPLRWKRPRLIFVNSMSDLFHEGIPFEYVDRVFAVMALAPQHTFQVLTKRADRMLEYMTQAGIGRVGYIEGRAKQMARERGQPIQTGKTLTWPLPNVWLGVSAGHQKGAEERIPLLKRTPAAVRFVSYEPALGEVKWGPLLADRSIGWVIVGGESGPGARPFDIAWAQRTVKACANAGVPCFVKQLGAKPNLHGFEAPPLRDKKGGDWSEWADEFIRVRQFPASMERSK